MPELQELPRASIEAIKGVGGQLRVAAPGPHERVGNRGGTLGNKLRAVLEEKKWHHAE